MGFFVCPFVFFLFCVLLFVGFFGGLCFVFSIHFKQVLTCTFRASYYSTRLSCAHIPVIKWIVCLGHKLSS